MIAILHKIYDGHITTIHCIQTLCISVFMCRVFILIFLYVVSRSCTCTLPKYCRFFYQSVSAVVLMFFFHLFNCLYLWRLWFRAFHLRNFLVNRSSVIRCVSSTGIYHKVISVNMKPKHGSLHTSLYNLYLVYQSHMLLQGELTVQLPGSSVPVVYLIWISTYLL